MLSEVAGRVSQGEIQPLVAGDPRELGGYEIRGRIGSGGMGAIYLGATRSGRDLAIKVIHPERTGEHEFRARFRREVSAATRVRSHRTAAVIDFDVDAATPWLATEYVTGPTLARAVAERGPLPEAAVRELVAGLAEALEAIHRHGLVHRDVKPGNIILGPEGPVLIDMGIVADSEATSLTTTGLQPSTPQYMSPEQARGVAVGPASDVWSAGAVAYLAATGRGAFGTGTLAAMTYRIVNDEPALVDLPYELRPLVAACLAKDPAARPTPAALLRAVTQPAAGADLPLYRAPEQPAGPGPADSPTHLSGPVAVPVPVPAPAPDVARERGATSAPGRRRGLLVGLVAAAVLVLGGTGATVWYVSSTALASSQAPCDITWEPTSDGTDTWGRCVVDDPDPAAVYHWKWVYANAAVIADGTYVYDSKESSEVIFDGADAGKAVYCIVTVTKGSTSRTFEVGGTVPARG